MFRDVIETEIVISAPPSEVRSRLLDFAGWDGWNPMINHVKGSKPAFDLVDGDKMSVNFIVLGNNEGQVVIRANDEGEFAWDGKLIADVVFSGRHFFQFEDIGYGKTKFKHGEKFYGLLVPLYMWICGRDKVTANYAGANKSFKEFVEQ